MNMFFAFEPEKMIQGIEIAKVGDINLNELELNKLKDKLLRAEHDTDIIRLARGEGRAPILDEIIANDNVIFNWGMKGQHAFHQQSDFRDFLEPNSVDIDMMKKVIKLFENNINYQYSRGFHSSPNRFDNVKNIVKKVYDAIDNENISYHELELIKDWICTVLHTSGVSDFKNISPWVSATSGNERYKTAYFFGMGQIPFSKRRMGKNKRFVIFDAWVNVHDEHYAYEKTQYLICKLKSMGLPWYPDRHHEIMLKYAIYPHNLIGYYYFENDNMLHYKINPHYWEHIESDSGFEISNGVYIEQSDVNFPANNPYRVIYSRSGNNFEVYDRR